MGCDRGPVALVVRGGYIVIAVTVVNGQWPMVEAAQTV